MRVKVVELPLTRCEGEGEGEGGGALTELLESPLKEAVELLGRHAILLTQRVLDDLELTHVRRLGEECHAIPAAVLRLGRDLRYACQVGIVSSVTYYAWVNFTQYLYVTNPCVIR